MPISGGEAEYARFGFRDLVARRSHLPEQFGQNSFGVLGGEGRHLTGQDVA